MFDRFVLRATGQVVSNESGDLMRMLNNVTPKPSDVLSEEEKLRRRIDLYPPSLQQEIDALNHWIYEDVNNGVYKCGFATTQVLMRGMARMRVRTRKRMR
eukprot:757845-Hanusia_phi.AAC.2